MGNEETRVSKFEDWKTYNEEGMRDAKVPQMEGESDLAEFIDVMVSREHDYGTAARAMSCAAVAAFNYVAGKVGASGFQASCADLDILRQTRGWEWGKILDFDKLLYPQYVTNPNEFPSAQRLLGEHREELAKRAQRKIDEAAATHISVADDVAAHWRWLVGRAEADGEAVAAQGGE